MEGTPRTTLMGESVQAPQPDCEAGESAKGAPVVGGQYLDRTWLLAQRALGRPVSAAAGHAASAGPRLAGRERLLLDEAAPDGGQYVATDCALYHRRPTRGERSWQQLAWVNVRSVHCRRPVHALLRLQTWPELGSAELSLPIAARSRLPGLAQERVNACRVASHQLQLTEEYSALVTAHRDPRSGEVSWRIRLRPDCDHFDPSLAVTIEAAVRSLRSQLGC